MGEKLYRKVILLLTILIVIFLFSFVYVKNDTQSAMNANINNRCIVIDAGHGGYDGGAVADDKTNEKDINLQISLKLKDILIKNNFEVIMTRDNDYGLNNVDAQSTREKKVTDMTNRLEIINDNPNSIVISIHQNKFYDKNAKGAQIFYNNKSQESEKLAGLMQKRFFEMIDNENKRKHKSSGDEYFLLENSINTAIIVECGFLSNDEEIKKLKDDKYQEKIAFAIFNAIMDYININE